ncbi:MAG: hypothetical protein HYV09_34575 [Deltaproteobacteria bacterium]|nr:hypothetical protein [Deltaproteobacteria bacterium]
MSLSGSVRVLALSAMAALSALACRRTQTTSATADAAPPTAAPTPVEQSTQGPTGTDPAAPRPRDLPELEAPRDNIDIELGSKTVPGSAAPPAPADPFDAAIASVRASAVGCFASLPPGQYSATIAVSVTAAGSTVSTSASGVDDPAVRKCLEQAATRTWPSSPDGRKLSIGVQVKG